MNPITSSPQRLRRFTSAILLALVAITARTAGAQPPEPEETMAAWRTVDQWVRAWAVPAEPQRIDPEASSGACITLRLSGRIVGRGTFMADDGRAVWHAARQAIQSAELEFPIERDAFYAQRKKEMAERITVELQVAGPLTPLMGNSFAEATAELQPGIHGVAARHATDLQAVFPGTMLATNVLPARGMQVAVGQLGLPPLEVLALREKHGLVVYRFDAAHLVQPRSGDAPVFLARGGRLIATSEVNGTTLRELADRMAGHLLRHRWPGDEPHGLTGNYLAHSNTYDPPIAPPREQAIAALALAWHSATPGVDPDRAGELLAAATEILRALTTVTEHETDPLASPTDAAAWLLAARTVERLQRGTTIDSGFASRAVAVIQDAWKSKDAWNTSIPPAGRALVALAMARSGDKQLLAAAPEAVRGLLRDTRPGELPALMPWLGWAELELSGSTGSIPSAEALRAMRTTLKQFTLSPDDLGPGQADLEGGVVFTRGGMALPTWQTLRPLAFSATMLGDARLTEAGEVAMELAELRRSLRFLMQLTYDDSSSWLAQEPDRARGGVRLSLWNQTASLDATALGLLTVSETLRSVEARATKPPPAGSKR